LPSFTPGIGQALVPWHEQIGKDFCCMLWALLGTTVALQYCKSMSFDRGAGDFMEIYAAPQIPPKQSMLLRHAKALCSAGKITQKKRVMTPPLDYHTHGVNSHITSLIALLEMIPIGK
jgi:hypothetical protein